MRTPSFTTSVLQDDLGLRVIGMNAQADGSYAEFDPNEFTSRSGGKTGAIRFIKVKLNLHLLTHRSSQKSNSYDTIVMRRQRNRSRGTDSWSSRYIQGRCRQPWASQRMLRIWWTSQVIVGQGGLVRPRDQRHHRCTR